MDWKSKDDHGRVSLLFNWTIVSQSIGVIGELRQ